MSDPISIRNIPPDVLKLAQALSTQTGLSINDEVRLALASGLLVEATKVTPKPNGTFAGLQGAFLAKALRRHLASAIDLLVEYGQHPHLALVSDEQKEQPFRDSKEATSPPVKDNSFASSIGEDLDMLGIGVGLSDTLESNE